MNREEYLKNSLQTLSNTLDNLSETEFQKILEETEGDTYGFLTVNQYLTCISKTKSYKEVQEKGFRLADPEIKNISKKIYVSTKNKLHKRKIFILGFYSERRSII